LAGLSLASSLCAQSPPEMRMLPAEMCGGAVDSNKVGSSGLAGVHTKVLFGDPSKPGFYSILLFVPAHTTIQAHSHRDRLPVDGDRRPAGSGSPAKIPG
jgi:hypothetical protein